MSDENPRTPLAPLQKELGARFVDFGGWDLPVLYTSIVDESDAVRNKCGIFDVSHMGRFFLSGLGVVEDLDRILSRDMTTLEPGKQRYSLLLNEDGGILDDLMAARIADQEFLLVVNAGNLESDREWIESHLSDGTDLIDRSKATVMIAVQGPEAERILTEVTGDDHSESKFMDVVGGVYQGVPYLAIRGGYTGEDGFEVILPNGEGLMLWKELIQAGAVPCGLGARDLLRLEVAYPLHGHEITKEIRPHEANLRWALSKKGDFIGRSAIESNEPRYDLIGFAMEKKAIPREGYPVVVDGEEVGVVTSGGLSSRMPNGFGLARVRKDSVEESLEIVIRGKNNPAKKVKTPFIQDRVKR
ncbi:MAG: glycine cleavage system aminomethyltransferase GcvT [Candidatus Omnitrophica bacterium]|nr:glycine cleavage system aminomethyltransferase GcvT [Candidatus Omnitrophota bacterium]